MWCEAATRRSYGCILLTCMHVAKFIAAHLLLRLLAVIVVFLVLLLFTEGLTWRGGGEGDDVTRRHITGLWEDICAFYNGLVHSSKQCKTWIFVWFVQTMSAFVFLYFLET